MKDLILKYKREFVYCSYIFLILELLTTGSFVINPYMYLVTSLIGLMLIVLWIYIIHIVHKSKKIRENEDDSILMNVSIKERIFTNVVMPIVFYFSVTVFLFINVSTSLNQIVIVLSVVLLFFLMLHIRTSYEKVYSIEKVTRYVYDFVNIFIYFILSSTLIKFGLDRYLIALILLVFSFFAFYYMLLSHRKSDGFHLMLAFFSSALVVGVFLLSYLGAPIIASAISTVVLYTLISLINLRFSGYTKVSEYIPTVMYALMAIILILSL